MEVLIAVLLILIIAMMFQIRRLRGTVDSMGADLRELAHKTRRIHDEIKAPGPTEGKSEPAVPVPVKPQPATPTPVPVAQRQRGTPAHPVAEDAPKAAPPPPAAPKPESPLVHSVREILRKIWQWIMVGEEYRPTGVLMEYAVATTWLMRAGIVAVVVCVGYFLKWSIDRELVGPIGRVAISVLTGLAMLIGGLRLLGKRWNILGQGFTGGGLAVLYFALYATGPLYHLLPITTVFGLMCLLTLATGVISVSIGSLLVAILGIIGGFGTPVMLSTGQAQLPALFAYLLILNVGILGIAHFRQWRLLNYLAFLGTLALAGGAIHNYYLKERDFTVTIVFLSLFFLIHSLLVLIYNVLKSLRSTVLEVLHMLLNAAIYGAAAYYLVRDAAGRPYPAIPAIALALYFTLNAFLFLRRRLVDRPLLLAMIGLAAFFAVVSVPMIAAEESLTIAWSLMSILLLWLSTRMGSSFLKHIGHLLFLLVFFRLAFVDFPRDFGTMAVTATFAEYGRRMLARLWTFGIAIAALFVGFRLELRAARTGRPADTIVAPPNDIGFGLPDRIAGRFFFWGVILALFVFLQFEFYHLLAFYTPLRPATLTILWCFLAGFFLWRFLADGNRTMLLALGICAVAAVVKSTLDMETWRLGGDACFHVEHTLAIVAMRWLDFAGVIILLGLGAWYLFRRGQPEGRVMARMFGYASLVLLFIYLTFEVKTLLFSHLPAFQGGGVSVLWTIFAFGMVAGGIWRKIAALRYAGLLLFAVVIGKVFMVDLANMPIIFRVVAFLVLGILLLLGAFIYLKAAKQFQKEIQQ